MATQTEYGDPMVALRMPQELYDALAALAASQDESVSAIMRAALRAYLQE